MSTRFSAAIFAAAAAVFVAAPAFAAPIEQPVEFYRAVGVNDTHYGMIDGTPPAPGYLPEYGYFEPVVVMEDDAGYGRPLTVRRARHHAL